MVPHEVHAPPEGARRPKKAARLGRERNKDMGTDMLPATGRTLTPRGRAMAQVFGSFNTHLSIVSCASPPSLL
jgi:hypothetical protein